MSITHWQKLYKDLTVSKNAPPSVKKPTITQLDQFEHEAGIPLPTSYRDFIRVFGPGVLAWSYRIMAPGYPEEGDSVDILLFNQSAKNQFDKYVLSTMRDPDRILRVVYFARTEAGDLIGWDPNDIRDKKSHEYGIYQFGRLDHMQQVAVSFRSFIDDVALSKDNLTLRPEDENELGTRYLFEPAAKLSKSKKSHKSRRKK